MRTIGWLLAAGPAVWAVMRIGGLDRTHPVVAMVSFTPHITVACLAVLVVLGVLRQWHALAVATVATLALAAVVLPRTLPGRKGEIGPRLRVLTVNVTFGSVPVDEVVDLVRERRVDVLSVQELTPEFDARLRRAGIGKLLPHDVVRPEDGATGTGIYARLELREGEHPTGGPFAQTTARLAWHYPVEIVSVHPPPPVSEQHVESWHETFAGLMPRDRRPRILAGDFNATLDHHAMRKLMEEAELTDAAETTGDGLTATWPADRALRPGIVIDHVLATGGFRAARTDVIELERGDHRAVFAELVADTRDR